MKSIILPLSTVILLATGGFAMAENSCTAEQMNAKPEQLSEKCRAELDTWSMSQPETSVDLQGDVAIGMTVPDTVQLVEVPAYKSYGYAVINKKRVLVDRNTHLIIKVY